MNRLNSSKASSMHHRQAQPRQRSLPPLIRPCAMLLQKAEDKRELEMKKMRRKIVAKIWPWTRIATTNRGSIQRGVISDAL